MLQSMGSKILGPDLVSKQQQICTCNVDDFLLAILIAAFDSSSLVFCMMYSAYKLNNQGDNIQP